MEQIRKQKEIDSNVDETLVGDNYSSLCSLPEGPIRRGRGLEDMMDMDFLASELANASRRSSNLDETLVGDNHSGQPSLGTTKSLVPKGSEGNRGANVSTDHINLQGPTFSARREAMRHQMCSDRSFVAPSNRSSDPKVVEPVVGGSHSGLPSLGNTQSLVPKGSDGNRGANLSINPNNLRGPIYSAKEAVGHPMRSDKASVVPSNRSSDPKVVEPVVGGSHSSQPSLRNTQSPNVVPIGSEGKRGANLIIDQEPPAQRPCLRSSPSSFPPHTSAPRPCSQQTRPRVALYSGPLHAEGGQAVAQASAFAAWSGVAGDPSSISWSDPAKCLDDGLQHLHEAYINMVMGAQRVSQELEYVQKNFVSRQKHEQLEAVHTLTVQAHQTTVQALQTTVQALQTANDSIKTLKARLEKEASHAL